MGKKKKEEVTETETKTEKENKNMPNPEFMEFLEAEYNGSIKELRTAHKLPYHLVAAWKAGRTQPKPYMITALKEAREFHKLRATVDTAKTAISAF